MLLCLRKDLISFLALISESKSHSHVKNRAQAGGRIAALAPDYTKAKLATISIFDLMDRKPRIDDRAESGQKPSPVIGKPVLESVDFNYPSRPDTTVLKRLSLKAEPGTTIALGR